MKGRMVGIVCALMVLTSLAYVAIEKVTGTLRGRTGTFGLQPTGSRTQGEPQGAGHRSS
jgi:Protein of unknown function (DUF3224)